MIQPSRARVEMWRQRLHRSLRDALDPEPVKPPKGEAAKRDFLARERDRLAALEEVRDYCRNAIESGEGDLSAVADIAANIGMRLLLAATPDHALRTTKRLFGLDRRPGAPIDPKSVEVGREVARAVSGGERLSKAIARIGGNAAGGDTKQTERNYRNHRRAAIEANAAEAMIKLQPVQSDLSPATVDEAVAARLREKEQKPHMRNIWQSAAWWHTLFAPARRTLSLQNCCAGAWA